MNIVFIKEVFKDFKFFKSNDKKIYQLFAFYKKLKKIFLQELEN